MISSKRSLSILSPQNFSIHHQTSQWRLRHPPSSQSQTTKPPPPLPPSNPSHRSPPRPSAPSSRTSARPSATASPIRRPWSELVDRSAFSKPESISDATLRIRKNYSYFRVNYLSCLAAVLAVSLLTNPFALLLLLALLAAWLFLYLFRPSDPPLVLFGRTFSERETLGVLVVSTVVVIFLTSVGSVLISALMVGLAIVCAHGAFRVPEDLFLDDQEPAATGFLSFLTGSASNTAASAVAARV
ncbi:prenylated RAB acceptor 1.B4 [Actinidia rufa]|uniref:PRA1 family protein n=1 Tax=Actinidia rufa TaxID=165716 RepID=A0A7J0E7K2_9ERIC|nr:prenylated RAB acceptor 1.B4 [Actinidia rufa]